MSATKPTAWLVQGDGEAEERFPLLDAPLLIGRDALADLRLGDRSLSGLHARVQPAAGGWKVVDLESRNGTFVNDVLVKQALLEDGDQLRLGRAELTFHDVAEDRGTLRKMGRLVEEIHRRFGPTGVRRAARRFAAAAVEHGIATGLDGQEEVEALRRLQAVVSAMIEERDPQTIFDLLLDTVIEVTRAERGFLIRYGETYDERRIAAARNFDREGVRNALAKVSRTVERRCLEKGDPLLVVDAAVDARFSGTQSVVGQGLRSVLAVPLRGPERAVGLIYLDNRFERGAFEEHHLPLLRMFADQAAVAVRNAELHAESARRIEEAKQSRAEVEELNRILSDRMARTQAELEEVKVHVLREQEEAPLKYTYRNIVAESRPMRDLFRLLDKVTESDVSVLIQGESGTGKELVARAIHFNGPRKNRPFVAENCAAIPETLLESELFGYVRGAFTGAGADKKGIFETANGGTLFLDEIGDMDLSMQKKLLRVLQEGEVRPVGGQRTVRVDVRILAASNQDLERLCAEGRFREDLFYRLNVITVSIPPLRERLEDIPPLVARFLDQIAETGDRPRLEISEDALAALRRHAWPGNVRELRNEIQRAAALSDHVIVPLVLSPALRRAQTADAADEEDLQDLGRRPMKDCVRERTAAFERRWIHEALRRCGGHKAGAARLLGVSRPTLDAKLAAHGIDPKQP